MVDSHIHFLPDLVFSHAAHAGRPGRHDDPRQERGQFEDVTTGAHNDLQRATDIARAIVSEYGMGETLGLFTYPPNPGPGFLGQILGGAAHEYSELTTERLDDEVRQILAQRETRVTQLVTDKKATLIAVAKVLQEKEVLMEDEFMAMVDADMAQKDAPA